MRLPAIAVALVLVGASASGAADQRIHASKLVLKRSSSGREKLTFVSRDPAFLFAPIGGADDPSQAGAGVTLVSPLEAPVTLAVPDGAGNPGWRVTDGATLDGYRFTNGPAPTGISVVRVLSLRQARGIKITARETGLALTAAQGSVGIRITTGSLRSCVLFDLPTIVADEPGRFVARGALVGAATDCSDGSLGESTTTSTTTTSTTSTTVAVCGDGVIQPPEECDGSNTNGAPNGVACFPPGSPNECQFCGTDLCRFPGPVEIPCCNPAASCIIDGPHHGVCVP